MENKDGLEWMGRAIEVNIDPLSNENLVVMYGILGRAEPTWDEKADKMIMQKVATKMVPLRLYNNVGRASLMRIAEVMSTADLMEGQAAQIKEYVKKLNERLL